jgi:hypothetical protein
LRRALCVGSVGLTPPSPEPAPDNLYKLSARLTQWIVTLERSDVHDRFSIAARMSMALKEVVRN